MPLINAYIGTGFKCGFDEINLVDFYIKGKSFNPYFPYNYFDSILGNIPNGGTLSLSGLQYGHEAIAALYEGPTLGNEYIEFRKGTKTLFTYIGIATFIGIDYDEIMSNGTDYYVDFGTYLNVIEVSVNWNNSSIGLLMDGQTVNGLGLNVGDLLFHISSQIDFGNGNYYITNIIDNTHIQVDRVVPYGWITMEKYFGKTVEKTLNYQITNFPTIVGPVESGKIWVEGSNLCFTDAVKGNTGYKHVIKNNGLIYSTGKTPGMFRVDSSSIGALGYIDEYGNERKTHLGDRYGSPGNNEPEMTGLTPGMIRVSTPEGNYGYLTFIGPNGRRYRIMNGDV